MHSKSITSILRLINIVYAKFDTFQMLRRNLIFVSDCVDICRKLFRCCFFALRILQTSNFCVKHTSNFCVKNTSNFCIKNTSNFCVKNTSNFWPNFEITLYHAIYIHFHLDFYICAYFLIFLSIVYFLCEQVVCPAFCRWPQFIKAKLTLHSGLLYSLFLSKHVTN